MKSTALQLLLGLALAGSVAPAHAIFHLWAVSEAFSNANGTVQFIELTALAGGQQFLAGHSLTSRSGTGTTANTFTFATDLPGDSAGKTFLVGTTGYAALGLAAPDYVVPNGFFFQGGGTIDFAGADLWHHGALPVAPLSLDRSGSTGLNSPRNFAGITGSVQASGAPSMPSYQGLWWASPAHSEPGWGMNLTHQGDVLFMTWFTYDIDGSGLWLVMPVGAKVGPASYTGTMYRMTGPPLGSAPFDSAAVAAAAFGDAQFTFGDGDNGTFTTIVDGVVRSRAITRQVFAGPVPGCRVGAAASALPNYQDLWWALPVNSESGWGLNIAHQGDVLFVTWFTYGADRKGQWLAMARGERTGPATYTGTLYRTRGPAWNLSPWKGEVTVTPVGSGRLTFTGTTLATFAYTVDGISQSKAITRQVFASPVSVCGSP